MKQTVEEQEFNIFWEESFKGFENSPIPNLYETLKTVASVSYYRGRVDAVRKQLRELKGE